MEFRPGGRSQEGLGGLFPKDKAVLTLLTHLAAKCAESIAKPDAGLWELRSGWREHSFTNLMCWAGLERVSRLAKHGNLAGLNQDFESETARAESAVRLAAIDGFVRNGPGDAAFNAAMVQMPILRFPDPVLNRATVEATAKALAWDGDYGPVFLLRYKTSDDFGVPKSAFVSCSFWLIQALAALGDRERAAALLWRVLGSANPLGLFPEHYEPVTGCQLGNFPQAYSHVGLINASFSVSPPWWEVL